MKGAIKRAPQQAKNMMKVCTREHQCKVLLVEDFQDNADLIFEKVKQFGDGGFELLHVPSLRQTLQTIERYREDVDLVLLDLKLEDCAGIETLDMTIDAARQVIPIVVLTNSDDDDLAIQAIQHGAQDYVLKSEVLAEQRSLCRIMRFSIERQKVRFHILKQNDALTRAEALIEAGGNSGALREIREVKQNLAKLAGKSGA
jgi:two-component system, cell cycle sensor histidine kinase and response regulator CckA